ncbi:TPA: ABC transporter permease [Staphylococcus delphini]|nr:ABC transporter permease [Staphylococcus delphini]HEC2203557.1 ABC transporter permease [Staphylococcus delphini]
MKIFNSLYLLGMREILRDAKLLFFSLIFPLFFLAMFTFIGKIIPNDKFTLSFDEFMFPGVLIYALFSIGVIGTALPLIDYKKSGVYKLFAINPVKKSTFITSQISVRLTLGIFQILLFLILGLLLKYIKTNSIMEVLLICIIILFFMIILGLLLSNFFKSSEIAGGVISVISAPILMLSNVLMPLEIFSKDYTQFSQFLPFSYMGDILRHAIFKEAKLDYSLSNSWIVIISFIFITYIFSILTFKFYKKI